MSNEFKIQIPTEIVRNKTLKAIEFVLLAKLIQAYYLSGSKEIYQLNHRAMMNHMNIRDNDTFKDAFNGLHDQGFVLCGIDKLPRKGFIEVSLNNKIIPELNEKTIFTQLTKNVLDKSVINAVGYIGVRLIYYYKSFINEKDTVKQYAHPSEELIAENLGISKTTVINYNKKLTKNKLVKIETHELTHNNEYIRVGDKELIYFTKYNNHYFINQTKIDKFAENNRDKLAI